MQSVEQSLIADIPRLTADEQRALRYVVDRFLVQGRASYAPWVADGDKRNMEKEIADELADAIVYTGMRAVMRAQRKAERVRRFKADEDFRRTDEALRGFTLAAAIPESALVEFASAVGTPTTLGAHDDRPPLTGSAVVRSGLSSTTPPVAQEGGTFCEDCLAPNGLEHRIGCQWTVLR